MTETASNEELRRTAAKFINFRTRSPARAWPCFGRDVTLVEEDGPAGTLLFACHTDDSMSNPMSIVHGGVTASLVDSCMGIVCAAQSGGRPTPTITMTVNYARPVPLNADIRVRVYAVRIGATTGQLSAQVFLAEQPEEILVTATGVYSIRH